MAGQRRTAAGRTTRPTDSTSRRRVLQVGGTAGVIALTGLAGCSGAGDGDDGGDGMDGGDGGGDDGGDGGDGGTTGTVDGGEDVFPDTLRVGHPSPARPVYNVPTYTTFLDRMAERDVTVEPKTFSGFTGVIAGMVSDEIDIAYTTPPSLVNSTNQGFPIRAISELSQRFAQMVIAQPEVESWEDLRGETLVAHSPQSFSALVLKSSVAANLGSVDAVEYRYIIGTPNRLAAMEAGETLATTVFTSGAISAEQEGYAKIFHNPNDQNEPMTLAQWTVLEGKIEENPEMYQQFVDEMTASYQDIYDGDSQTLAEAAINSPTNFPEFGAEIWAQTIDQAKADEMFPRTKAEQSTPEKLSRSLEVAVQTELIEEAPDPNSLVDRRFLE